MGLHRSQFPNHFLFGAATSSYQIEGAANLDGRSPSIWDTFAHSAGRTKNGDTGDVACDHYHRYLEDANLMQQLNFNAYRFSTSWSRVLPEGTGQINQAGIDFYSRLVDSLLERGIEPWLTLYHWDLPQALEDKGGWGARDTAFAFAEYAQTMATHLGDRVKNWFTHNEPWCTAFLGHQMGVFAPGKQDPALALQVAHHLLLSHGLAIPAIQNASSQAKVGAALNLWTVHPASATEADILAAKRYDGFANRWFLDPLYKQSYPADMLELYGQYAPKIEADDMAIIATPTDFLGVNYYMRMVVADDPTNPNLGTKTILPKDSEYTDFNWEIYPDGLRECLERVQNEYNPNALYITENGACYDDDLNAEGIVADHKRQKYLEQHLEAARQAHNNGAKLHGYFAWSLLDNFEWAEGYSRRFGLVHVDFKTQKRTPKLSAHWYKNFLGNP